MTKPRVEERLKEDKTKTKLEIFCILSGRGLLPIAGVAFDQKPVNQFSDNRYLLFTVKKPARGTFSAIYRARVWTLTWVICSFSGNTLFLANKKTTCNFSSGNVVIRALR